MAWFNLHTPSNSSWLVAATFVGLGSFALGITPAGDRLQKGFMDWLPGKHQQRAAPIARALPDVLLIGGNSAKQANVALTVSPRGYKLILAETVAAGLDTLRGRAGHVGLVLLD